MGVIPIEMTALNLGNGRRIHSEKTIKLPILILQIKDGNDFTNLLAIQKMERLKIYMKATSKILLSRTCCSSWVKTNTVGVKTE